MSILDVSLATANKVYNIAWWASICSAGVTFVAITSVFWSDSIRDRATEEAVAASNLMAHEAQKGTALAHERAAALEASAEQMRARSLEIELSLEQERQIRIKLEQNLGPRNLSRAAAQEIIDTLRGQDAVVSVTLLGDAEANSFGRQLFEAIQTSGAEVSANMIGVISPPQYGLFLSGDIRTCRLLESAFNKAGLQFSGGGRPPTSDLALCRLVVGLKAPFNPER